MLEDGQVLSGVDDEELEPHITSYEEGGVEYRKCNYCGYVTDRQDRLTIPEHLFSHLPDITGCACPVCRRPEKRKSLLMKHLEECHTKEVLTIMGVPDISLYDQQFSSFSEEQKALRKENYIRSKCHDCKAVFWSLERIELHKKLGFCNAEMIANIRSDSMRVLASSKILFSEPKEEKSLKKNMEISIKKENLESSGNQMTQSKSIEFHLNFLDKGSEVCRNRAVRKRGNRDRGRCANNITGREPGHT